MVVVALPDAGDAEAEMVEPDDAVNPLNTPVDEAADEAADEAESELCPLTSCRPSNGAKMMVPDSFMMLVR